MTEQLDEESAKSNEQEVKHARHVLNTAKLVVTFAAGIAATFVATSLQGRDENCWDEGAAVLMFVALGITIGVVVLRSPGHKRTYDAVAAREATNRAELAHWLMVAQIGLAALASLAAAVGLIIQDYVPTK
jgi:hypothetical protein